MKLVDINCIFELFFLELGFSLTNDTNSIGDSSFASEFNFQSQFVTNSLQDCSQNDDNLSEKCESKSTQQNKDSSHDEKRSSSEIQLKVGDSLEINNKQEIESIAINNTMADNFIDHLMENATHDNQSGAKNRSSENEDYLTGLDSSQYTTISSDSVVVETKLPKQQEELLIKSEIPDEYSIFARINARENQQHANIVPIPDLRPMITTKKYNINYKYSDDNSTSSSRNNILQNQAIIQVEPAKESRQSIEARPQHTRQMNNTIHFKDTKDSVETNIKSNLSNEPKLKYTRENNFGT